MGLMKCIDCGKDISDRVDTVCPNCGSLVKEEDIKKSKELSSSNTKAKIIIFLSLIVALATAYFIAPKETTEWFAIIFMFWFYVAWSKQRRTVRIRKD